MDKLVIHSVVDIKAVYNVTLNSTNTIGYRLAIITKIVARTDDDHWYNEESEIKLSAISAAFEIKTVKTKNTPISTWLMRRREKHQGRSLK